MNHSKLYIIVLICLVFDVYANVLGGQFVYDDHYFIDKPYTIHSLSDFGAFFTDVKKTVNEGLRRDTYRPLSNISMALTYQVFGLDPFPYHLINVILHALNAVLVFYVCRCFPPLCKGRKGGVDPIYPPYPSPFDVAQGRLTKGGDNVDLKAFFIAAIFAVHPVQTESVGLIAYRSNGLFLFFMLAAFLCYLKVPPLCKGRKGGVDLPPLSPPYKGGEVLYYLASLLLYILSIFSKETGIILPALILVYYAFVPNPPSPRPSPTRGEGERSIPSPLPALSKVEGMGEGEGGGGLFKHFIRLIPFFAVGIAFVIVRTIVLGQVSQASQARTMLGWGMFAHVLSIILALGTYFKLALFPLRLTAGYLYPTLPELYSPWTGVALSFVILAIYFSWRLRKVSYVYPLSMAWFLVALLPSLNIIPLKTPLNERFLYLPIIGFAMFLVQGVFDICFFLKRVFSKSLPLCKGEPEGVDLPSLPLPLRRCSGQAYKGREVCSPLVIIFLVIVLCFYSARTVIRNKAFAGPIQFWSAMLRDSPENDGAPLSLGVEYYNMGDMDRAAHYFLQAMRRLNEHGMNARIDLALVFETRGDIRRAMAMNEDTMRLFPNKAPPFVYQGRIYTASGDYKKAEEMFLIALKNDPDSSDAHLSIADLYDKAGLPKLANEHRQKALNQD